MDSSHRLRHTMASTVALLTLGARPRDLVRLLRLKLLASLIKFKIQKRWFSEGLQQAATLQIQGRSLAPTVVEASLSQGASRLSFSLFLQPLYTTKLLRPRKSTSILSRFIRLQSKWSTRSFKLVTNKRRAQ